MTWAQARPRRTHLAGVVARAAGHAAWDRATVRAVTDPAVVPPRLEAITPQWLTGVLCGPADTARVRGFTVSAGSSGTSVRGALALDYDGAHDGLPASVFAKSTPGVLNRVANVATGTSEAEGRFYAELRPQLGEDVQIPVGYHSAVDARTLRSLHLIEDLVATSGATFPSAAIDLSREQAEQVVDLLAHVHRTFAGAQRPGWLRTYRGWWADALRIADVRGPNDAFFRGDPLCPAPLRGRGDDAWAAFVRSVDLHDELPATVIHADVHAGNWYLTGDGRPGLCDWQCVAHGHPSLDLAYALTTLLPTERRRAWERDLVARHDAACGMPGTAGEAWLNYRRQIPGALLKWTPTLNPPPGLPDMQPRAVSEEMLRRITAAMVDLDVLDLPVR